MLTLAIVTLINMGYSQNIIADSKNDWEKEGLKGKVKSKIREISYFSNLNVNLKMIYLLYKE